MDDFNDLNNLSDESISGVWWRLLRGFHQISVKLAVKLNTLKCINTFLGCCHEILIGF